MRILVCNDLHLKPAASDYDVEAMKVPDDLDAVFVAGDLTHRDGEDDVALARRFVERFTPDVPVMYVPGNHDPAPMPERVVDGLENATSGHDAVHECEWGTVVGWGCEHRSLEPAIDQTAFPAIDPRTAPRGERRYAADRTADTIEDALLDIVSNGASARDAAAELDIASEHRGTFRRGVDTVQKTYDHLAGLLGDRSNVVLVSHLSPFNTSFDRHHSTGTRETDREGLHTGSIALALVARTHDVYATISGHSHAFGYDTGDRPGGVPHMLNLGFRGIGIVDFDPDAGKFSFTDANPD
ncbi:metallophosphoesterase [Haloarchaeobius sp. DYHT-AS-18]|uniref:metallophosphoesterase n=1 Tax=Haloarchaeobius sp. DYHT-AS-18 TaxID=3446117 RepID=UPI003EBD7D6B